MRNSSAVEQLTVNQLVVSSNLTCADNKGRAHEMDTHNR